MEHRLGRCSVLLLTLFAGYNRLLAQEPRFAGEAGVLVVEVPVRVLLHGRPVTGLTAEDFELYERGERRELVGFEVLQRGITEPFGMDPMEGSMPAPGPNRGRAVLVLFDFAYSTTWGLAQALEASHRLVAEQLGPEDEVAVVFFSALRGLRFLTDFTADRARAVQALAVVGAMLIREPELAGELFDPLLPAAPPSGVALATRDEVVREAGILVRADPFWPHLSVIRSFTRALAQLPVGRERLPAERHVLYFSHGFPSRFLSGKGSAAALHHLEVLFRSFRQQGWAIQAINVGGTRARGGVDTLFLLAHETGGESYENFNDPAAALARLLERTSVTYLLAFQVDDPPYDGHFRRLKVRLRNPLPGARVIHRPGYYGPER